jgi:hypothetical protein
MKIMVSVFIVITIIITNLIMPGFLTAVDVATTRNTLKEIEAKKGKIVLTQVRAWGDEESGDSDEMYFKSPSAVTVDQKGNVYIADVILDTIKVFDARGKFIRKIGKKGQGPGDVIYPRNLRIDKDGNLWVNDFGNRRIQVFSLDGKSKKIFKAMIPPPSNMELMPGNRVAYSDFSVANKGKGLIQMAAADGKKVKPLGVSILPPIVNQPFRGGKYDFALFSYDGINHRYYCAYHHSQMLQVYDEQFKLERVIFYETPMNSLNHKWQASRNNFDPVKKPGRYNRCVGVDTDDRGNVFMIATTREPRKEEKSMFVNFLPLPAGKDYATKTDMYMLYVFDSNGKMKAAKQLDVYCEVLDIHGDYIFIIDQVFNKVIYQYKYKFVD